MVYPTGRMEIIQTSIVFLGDGFTPQLVRGKALVTAFGAEPTNSIATPVLGNAEFASGLSLTVQPDRLDVREKRPKSFTPQLRDVAMKCLGFWPLVDPKAVGVNLVVGESFTDGFDRARAFDYVDQSRIESIIGTTVADQRHTFTFRAHGARATIQLYEGPVPGKEAGLVLDLNAHYEPPVGIRAVLDSGPKWLERVQEWMVKIAADR